MNFSTTHYSGTSYQNGAVLIITLMLLVIMTILGVSAVTTTTMQEKMAGNMHNKNLSFQAAEAAMRFGESIAMPLSDATDFSAEAAQGIYPRTNYTTAQLLADPPTMNWQDGDNGNLYLQFPVVNAAPQYIVEDYGTAPKSESCAKDTAETQICCTCCLQKIFRVTAKGSGLTAVGQTLLQSTVRQACGS